MTIESGPGGPDLTAIERHCRLLLVAYPRRYREERADEIVDTLLEVAGADRSWPSARDARALVLGGLRVRAGLQQRLTSGANVRQALLLAAVLMLAQESGGDLGSVGWQWRHISLQMFPIGVDLVLGLTTLAVLLSAWFRPTRIAGVAALATACLWAFLSSGTRIDRTIEPIAALCMVAIMAFRRERLPRPWLWLAVPWFLLLYLLPSLFPDNSISYGASNFGPLLILAATIGWGLLDLRPMLAVALWLAILTGASVTVDLWAFSAAVGQRSKMLISLLLTTEWRLEVIAVTSTVLVIVAIWRLRRQALL